MNRSTRDAQHAMDVNGHYYEWRSHAADAQGREILAWVKPGMLGWGAPDPARLLLTEHIKVERGQTLFDLNCGSGVVGALALQMAPGSHVLAASSNAVDLEATRRTLAAIPNGILDAKVCAGSGTRGIPERVSADVVSMRLPKGKLPALQMILDAHNALQAGGRAYLAGANTEGIKTYLRHMEDLFGSVQVLAYRKRHRIGVAVKTQGAPALPPAFQVPWLDHERIHRFQIEARGDAYHVRSRPGVFSWNRLDGGTQALLETIEIARGESVLDLGCGYGIVGFVAARLAAPGPVHLVDAGVNAVEAARQGATANQLGNCHITLSDCAQAVQHMTFDVVATNPPFHRGTGTNYDISRQFIRDAAQLLRLGGRLYLVANRFLPYEPLIRDRFAEMVTLHENSRYKVLRAIR